MHLLLAEERVQPAAACSVPGHQCSAEALLTLQQGADLNSRVRWTICCADWRSDLASGGCGSVLLKG